MKNILLWCIKYVVKKLIKIRVKKEPMMQKTVIRIICIYVACVAATTFANTWYVSTNSPSDGPGTSWNNAFHTIQGGVNVASDNDTVLVTNGVYDIGEARIPIDNHFSMNRVLITNNITLQSVNGRDLTFIVGEPDPTTGSNGVGAVRGVCMTANAILDGFTVTNGYTQSLSWDLDESGGGVLVLNESGVVSNCTLIGNAAHKQGGGAYSGTLHNCVLSGNSANAGGGGFYAIFNSCLLTGNTAINGGGVSGGELNNCTIRDNRATKDGGGGYYAEMHNCVLSGNMADEFGGGVNNSVLGNCVLS